MLPAASRALTVTVTLPPEVTVGEATVTKELAGAIAPGVTVIVGRVVDTAEPPIVAPIVVAVPDSTPVKVAV